MITPAGVGVVGGAVAAGALVPEGLAGALVGACTLGALPQAASIPTMQATHQPARKRTMTLLLLEALGAGLLLVGIIWWTMFSGRKNGELPQTKAPDAAADQKNLTK
jgi:cytoskeletal protein RodZ